MVTAKYVTDGDVGCGAPGSLSWHKAAVAEMSDEKTVGYLLEVMPGMSDDDVYGFLLHLIKGKANYGNNGS